MVQAAGEMPDPEEDLVVRAAWLYYVAANNQEETARILDVSRVKVARLLATARESGIVTISIDHRMAEMLDLEAQLCAQFDLDFCIATPVLSDESGEAGHEGGSLLARRAVAIAAARFLRERILAKGQRTVGLGWGRTMGALTRQLGSLHCSDLQLVSLMGSLTRKSAANPYEVVHELANRTGGAGYFLPVPFIADSQADRDVLRNQRSVQEVLTLAAAADFYMVSLGECDRGSFIYRNQLISEAEMQSLEAAGAVGDTLGKFFDAEGALVDSELNERSLAVDYALLQSKEFVLLAAGAEKVASTRALLNSGLVDGLIVDGTVARQLAQNAPHGRSKRAATRPGRASRR